MFFKELGGILLFLLAFVIFANLWFHFIESILRRVRAFLKRHEEPMAWHPLKEEQEPPEDQKENP